MSEIIISKNGDDQKQGSKKNSEVNFMKTELYERVFNS